MVVYDIEFEIVDIKKLKVNNDNPRKHSKKQLEMLKKSVEQFGWTNPIIVDRDYNILAGHLRYNVAVEMGIREVPVIKTNLSDERAKAYMVVDNKITEEASWDYDKLEKIVRELKEFNFEDYGLRRTYDIGDFDVISVEKTGWKSNFMFRDNPLISLRIGNYAFISDDERVKKLYKTMIADKERAKVIERRIIAKLVEVYDELMR